MPTPKTNPVTITGISSDGKVTMQPHNGDVTVNAGEYIQWNINPNSNVQSISTFTDNSSVNIFSSLPSSANNWKGQVSSSDSVKGKDENYTIIVVQKGSNQSFPHDPKITVNR
jgi:hypothetical protein